MKIRMMVSVCTAKGAFNEDEIYTVDKEQGAEWVKLGYAVKVGSREAAANAPAKRTATKRKASKR
jgi:hypothetical protein